MNNSAQVRLLYKGNLVGEVHLEPHFVLRVYENLRLDDVAECGSINRIQALKKSTSAQVLHRPPVLRHCFLMPYVPLRDDGSANVPALKYFFSKLADCPWAAFPPQFVTK